MTDENARVKITKGSEEIEIHPDALEDHKRLGWVVVGEDPEVAATPVEKPEVDENKSRVRRRVGTISVEKDA